MTIELVRTGRAIPFLNVSYGSVFYAHGKMWIRMSHDTASKLSPSDYMGSVCSFTLEPEDEIVEYVNLVIDGVAVIPIGAIESTLPLLPDNKNDKPK